MWLWDPSVVESIPRPHLVLCQEAEGIKEKGVFFLSLLEWQLSPWVCAFSLENFVSEEITLAESAVTVKFLQSVLLVKGYE